MRRSRTAAMIGWLSVCASMVAAFGDTQPSERPGVLGGGVTLLPNGWKIAPAGRHISVGGLPLAMVETPDESAVLVANNGYARPSISVVDLQNRIVRSAITLDHAWLGMAWHPDGQRLYVSGAGNNTVHELRLAAGKLPLPTKLVSVSRSRGSQKVRSRNRCSTSSGS